MENQICAVCGQPMRYINQGVSRTTGKPYNGFWACNDRTHKQQAPQAVYQAPQPIYQPQQAYQPPRVANLAPRAIIQPARDVDWDKISRGKCKFGFLIEAYKLGKALQEAEMESELWADASMRNLADSPLTPAQEGEINLNEPPF